MTAANPLLNAVPVDAGSLCDLGRDRLAEVEMRRSAADVGFTCRPGFD
jgi:hypothetical protein